MKVGQYEADRLVQDRGRSSGRSFGAVGHADAVAPVLSGWALGAVVQRRGAALHQGELRRPEDSTCRTSRSRRTSAPTTRRPARSPRCSRARTRTSGDGRGLPGLREARARVRHRRSPPTRAGRALRGTTNQPIKHLAQHDQRMYDAYKAYFALLAARTSATRSSCTSRWPGTPGLPEIIYQYGYWGSIVCALEDPADVRRPTCRRSPARRPIASVVHHCPKYRALAEQALE